MSGPIVAARARLAPWAPSRTRRRSRPRRPAEIVCTKVTDRLNHLTREYVERSPFLCLATADADGNCDVSPRGDPAGFVRILDDRTVLLPERPGNRIADSLTNILANPHVGLLFMIPGATETFRINGRARLVTDRALLEPCAVEGKVPRLGILVDVDQAYTQCSKALLRSQLWDPDRFVAQGDLPSNGRIMHAINGDRIDPEEYDVARAERYARRENFY
jgi:PPOX class probable FMN-dependent enzyme